MTLDVSNIALQAGATGEEVKANVADMIRVGEKLPPVMPQFF